MNFEVIKFIIETILSVGLTSSAIYISVLIYKNERIANKTSETTDCLTDLFSEYKETMKKLNKALELSKELEKYLEECIRRDDFSDFNKEYYSPKYDPLRDVHYFFELLGAMVKNGEISEYAVQHYFSFPIEYFMETKNMRSLIENYNCLPSYGENFCRLFVMYDSSKRERGKQWIKNGKGFTLSKDEAKDYLKGIWRDDEIEEILASPMSDSRKKIIKRRK
jgi:hypothetical protein